MKHVLIVDDRSENRLILRELLEPLGWVCTEADNGVDGLAALNDVKPDLILTDYEMPGMNGLELLKSIKDDPSFRTIPVILITAISTDDFQTQALNSGAAIVLPKPFEFEVLFKAVHTFVDEKLSLQDVSDVTPRQINILLVEDNPGDIRLTQEALKEVDVQAYLFVVNDGEAAMEFLRQEGLYTDAERPDLILLDLNLPKKSGHEVLVEVKADENFKTIPVVILSSSDQKEDIAKAHENFANCYVTKPTDLNKFWSLVKNLVEFWSVVAKIPSKD